METKDFNFDSEIIKSFNNIGNSSPKFKEGFFKAVGDFKNVDANNLTGENKDAFLLNSRHDAEKTDSISYVTGYYSGIETYKRVKKMEREFNENNKMIMFEKDSINSLMKNYNFNNAQAQLIFNKAFEESHAYGFGEIKIYIDEYADFVSDVIDAH